MTTDLYPTQLALAGLPQRADQHLDGVNLAPLLTANQDAPPRALHWHFSHYHGSGNRPTGAIRRGDYKLIEWFEDGRMELYDVASDLGETTDLADQMPREVAALRKTLEEWRKAVDARMPTSNPDWAPPEGR